MSEKVLFVDDESNVLSAFRRSFRGTFQVETASNAVEALAKVMQGDTFAVVVSDLNMPGVDGLQLLREFQKRSSTTVRLMLTGNADVSAAMAAVDQGEIHRYLTKPCTQARLSAAINEGIDVFRRKRLARQRPTHQPPSNANPNTPYHLFLADLKPGDVLAVSAVNSHGAVLVSGGETLTKDILARLRAHGRGGTFIQQPIAVYRAATS